MDTEQIESIVEQVLAKLSKQSNDSEQNVTLNLDKTELAKSEAKKSADLIIFPEGKELGVKSPHNLASIERAQEVTPARIGIGRAGTRMRTRSYLQFRIDHAAAQDAVLKDVDEAFLAELGLPILETEAQDMQTYLMNLDAGRKLNQQSAAWLEAHGDKHKQVQIIVCDGLSSSAVEANAADLLPALKQGLKLKGISVAKPVFIKRARVWVQDHVASILKCDVIISLIGERPGLATAEGISAYMIYKPTDQTVEADRTVISNIHRGGLAPIEAGAYLADIIEQMLKHQASGVRLSRLRQR